MTSERTERRKEFLINAAYVAVAVGGVWLAARWAADYLMPILLAVPVAALLQRPRRWLEKRLCGGGRVAANVLVTLLLLLISGAAALLIWGMAVWLKQGGVMPESSVTASAGGLSGEWGAWGRSLLARLPTEWQTPLSRFLSGLPGALSERLTAWAAQTASALVSRLPSLLFELLIFWMAACALTVEYEAAWAFALRQLPPARQQTVTAARRLCGDAAHRMGRAYGRLLLLTFAELLAGFWLIGLDKPLIPAALTAVVDILPVLGVGTVLIPWAAVCLLLGQMRRGMALLLLWGAVSLVRRVAEPRIVGREMGLPPLVMLAALLLGYRLSGLFGLLLYPVAAMLLRELHRGGYLRLWK